MKFGQGKAIWLGVVIVTVDFGGNATRCADELWHFLCTCTVVFPLKE